MAVTWTDEQQKVISLRDRNILVSAAAGSGKTAVLVQRILGKLTDRDRPVDIDRLLIMTFTRAAAGEMKERISRALEKALYEDPENDHLQRQMTLIHTAQITTIDGFCSWLLRNYFHMIDLDPGYRVADEGELKLLKEDVLKELIEALYQEKDEEFLNFAQCYATGKTDDTLKELILDVYEAAMSNPWPEEWLEEAIQLYRTDSLEELKNASWMELMWQTVSGELEEAARLAREAQELCGRPGGPYLYENALESDLLLIQDLRKKT
ncbi:MAG: UvrD-helicase domain-containing protein, partial [Blautia sp.]|nr:UvrD-helicase domain-containing protein [Blautia sp.]